METNKSQDVLLRVISALISDILMSEIVAANTAAVSKTLKKVKKRYVAEGSSFLTKTLPRLGKALDAALSSKTKMNSTSLGFKAMPGTCLPRFLGEVFIHVLDKDGEVLQQPDAQCVGALRDILYCFYKYEIPYSRSQEQQVIEAFKGAEADLSGMQDTFVFLQRAVHDYTMDDLRWRSRRSSETAISADPSSLLPIVREARILLNRVFASFDCMDINPRHGPGVVATKQRLEKKFHWTNISSRLTDLYPLDAYFFASGGHVCDSYDRFSAITDKDLPAQVILVPKDSRGPRLISCEPVDFQWIQQGLRQAIYRHVEQHELTKGHVVFTDQTISQRCAREGSINGELATLDLKEASDRVSLELVRLLFPEHIFRYLEASRSSATILPDGSILKLKKFAPMGSALCFPVMALTIWSLLSAGLSDTDAKSIVVYGDDVIVPTAKAEYAMMILESFGLKINRDKSFFQGSFRESCGVDAFQGVDVTPVRLRTVWTHRPSPGPYVSWISYANAFYRKGWFSVYDEIVELLGSVYGPIPSRALVGLSAPSLLGHGTNDAAFKRRANKALQKMEYLVRVECTRPVKRSYPGWEKLLRYFSEHANPKDSRYAEHGPPPPSMGGGGSSVEMYTPRHASKLAWRWR